MRRSSKMGKKNKGEFDLVGSFLDVRGWRLLTLHSSFVGAEQKRDCKEKRWHNANKASIRSERF